MHKCNAATGSTVFFNHWLPDWMIVCASIDQVAPVRGLGPMFHSHNNLSLFFCPLFRMGVLMWWLMMRETEWLLLLLPIEMTSRYVEGPHDCQGYSNRWTRQAEIHHFIFAYFDIFPSIQIVGIAAKQGRTWNSANTVMKVKQLLGRRWRMLHTTLHQRWGSTSSWDN